MSRDVLPGDVELSRCMLRSLDGKREFNALGQIAFIDIYEGITQPLIQGDVTLRDGIGLLRSFPIIGEEQLEIEFATPTHGKRKYLLNVERVGNVTIDRTNKSIVYTLRVVSPEQFTNAVTLVSQRFKNEISKTVEQVLSDRLGVSKPVEVAPTTGIDDHLVTNLSPLQVIDKLRHRAISPDFSSSSFAFFEDVEKFRFVTVEELLKNARSPVASYFYDDNLQVDFSQVKFRDMINFHQAQTQDTTQRLHSGSVKNIVKKYDMITGNVEDVVFDESDHVGAFEQTGKYARDNTKGFISNNNTPSKKMIMPWTPDKDPEEIADKKGLLHNFVAKIMQNISYMNIYGDSDLKLGDSLECTFINGHGLTTRDKVTVTNRYVIAKIRHSSLKSNRPVYTQSIG